MTNLARHDGKSLVLSFALGVAINFCCWMPIMCLVAFVRPLNRVVGFLQKTDSFSMRFYLP